MAAASRDVEFPVFHAPAPPPVKGEGNQKIELGVFLDRLHGPAASGVPPSGDLADATNPRALAFDVRSPSEFAKGHIPGAINLPLFSDDERAIVGTDYNRKGRTSAIRVGLGCVGPKLGDMIDAVKAHGGKEGDPILVYCWRGGMRSGSTGWLLSLAGFKVSVLDGGYRSYRRWCRATIGEASTPAPSPVVVLGGCTGSGKTEVLHALRRKGEQVLDLEGLANHRGSAFGAVGQPPQPSNETYENRLAFAVRRLNPTRPVWIEHEGKHVGQCSVPLAIYGWVLRAPGGVFAVMCLPLDLRARRLVTDYCSEEHLKDRTWVDGLKQCISAPRGGLAKRLGGARVQEAMRCLDEGNWESVSRMMLEYYDKLYVQWQKQSEAKRSVTVECDTADADVNAERIYTAVAAELSAECAPEAHLTDDVPAIPSPVEPEAKVLFQGSCFCGEVVVKCRDQPRSVSYCHCTICRRLTGAPFSAQALFPSAMADVELEPGAKLQSLQTSRAVTRQRCATCQSPVRATLFGGKFSAIPLGMLGRWTSVVDGVENPLQPQHHLHYAERVMDVVDGLPKYASGVRPIGGKPSDMAADLNQAGAPVQVTGKLIPETNLPEPPQPPSIS